MLRPIVLSVCALVLAVGCGGSDASAPAEAATSGAKTIVTGLKVPWGIAFLPDRSALIAERTTGRIVRVGAGGGRARPVMTVSGVSFTARADSSGLRCRRPTRATSSSTPT